jgi:phytol kinase
MLTMIEALAVVILAVAFLSAVEYLSRRNKYPPEISRKFIHISGGTVAAFTPWFLSWHQIETVAAALFVILLVSRFFHVFRAINSVTRASLGDLLFALSIFVIAIIANDRLIFAVAILHMGLADGLTAVVGSSYGNKTAYKVLGRRKSLIGSGTFYICSLLILTWYLLVGHIGGNWVMLIWLPLVATGLEAIGLDGTDNLIIPVVIALILNRL